MILDLITLALVLKDGRVRQYFDQPGYQRFVVVGKCGDEVGVKYPKPFSVTLGDA